ncbi:MAG: phosphoribosylformylglycinamidine synthase subunit PurQ [Armatimonadota bacterium]|nr:phosphoribosylformylglycinamidine synthase subunit PurQ [Armatimonadota bacterium]MCX7777160.1 phosphoribosylformylglycinamidine synthase subunit PurQ [Armatimonadota bacterium]MDW8024987.1 phosphoribosylformylglycinamidine synthase subunit PurQ [Armatimonadota bacterium]
MRFGIVVFAGSNCDQDCYHVIRNVFKKPVEYIWHEDANLKGVDCVVLPGGFSYGDYLRPGAIAKFSKVMDAVIEFAQMGGLVIGICNGFQILLEAGLLPGAMMRNSSLQFVCKFVHLRVENVETPFTNLYQFGQVVRMPIAHGDGNYYCDEQTLGLLKVNGQIVFRYCDENGNATPMANPNGSLENIAGICNERKNVLGMMPHPERCSEDILGSADGLLLWQSIIRWLDGKS